MIRIAILSVLWIGIMFFVYPTTEVQSETAPEDLFSMAKAQEDKYFQDMTPFIPATEKAIECLALNIYHEARNESTIGQASVAWVVINRVQSDKFPDSVCGVVYEARYSKWWKEAHGKNVPLRHQCQFSWYCDGKSDRVYEWDKFEEARSIAYSVLMNKTPADPTNGALWYHADYVNPSWANDYTKTAKIGTHIFYRN